MNVLLQLFCRVFALVPRRGALALGRALGFLFGSVLRYRRREAMAAMRRAFPEKDAAEIRRMADGMYRHLGLTLAEIARLAAIGPRDLEGHVQVVRDEAHRQLASQPGGALVLMGHIGNWELAAAINATLPRKVHAIVKPLKPAALQAFVERTRAMLGLHLMSFRGDFGDALRALRRGEIVSVILDQNQRRTMGVFVDFLGESACTSHGLAILASMSGVPVFPISDVRGSDGVHRIQVMPPFSPPPDRQPETLQRYTQQYTRALEELIRRNPEQWTWIHHRWRTRPPEPVDPPAAPR